MKSKCDVSVIHCSARKGKQESTRYFRTKLADGRCCEKARRGIQKLVLHMLSLSVFGSTPGQEAGVVASGICEGHADRPQFVCEAGCFWQ